MKRRTVFLRQIFVYSYDILFEHIDFSDLKKQLRVARALVDMVQFLQ